MSNREEYLRKMHAKLDELNDEIDLLSTKAAGVTVDLRKEYHGQIESLKTKQEVVKLKVEEFQRAGGSALEDMKSGLDLAWSAIGEAIDSARSRFK